MCKVSRCDFVMRKMTKPVQSQTIYLPIVPQMELSQSHRFAYIRGYPQTCHSSEEIPSPQVSKHRDNFPGQRTFARGH